MRCRILGLDSLNEKFLKFLKENKNIEILSTDDVKKLIEENQPEPQEINSEVIIQAGPEGPKGDPGSIGPNGDKGEPGEKGDPGDSLLFENLTEDQKNQLKGPQGEQGLKGDVGPVGPTGRPGRDGTSILFEDLTEEQLNAITGPQGLPGEKGDVGKPGKNGLSLTFRGVWDKSKTYKKNDIVYFNGSSYIALKKIPEDTDILFENYWHVLALKGKDGEHGGPGGSGTGVAEVIRLINEYAITASDLISASSGSSDAGKPIMTNSDGVIDGTLIDLDLIFAGNVNAPLEYSVSADELSLNYDTTDFNLEGNTLAIAEKYITTSGGTITGDLTVCGDTNVVDITTRDVTARYLTSTSINAQTAAIFSDNAYGTQLTIANTTSADASIALCDGYSEKARLYIDHSDGNKFKISINNSVNVFELASDYFKINTSGQINGSLGISTDLTVCGDTNIQGDTILQSVSATNISADNVTLAGNLNVSGTFVTNGTLQYKESGFENRTDSQISFDDATQTFTISPTGDSYNYYINGIKHTITETISATIAGVEGECYLYFNEVDETLNCTNTFTSELLSGKYAIVSIIYWDAENKTAIYVADERHGYQMDGSTHALWHLTLGTEFLSGLALGDFTVDGSGDLDIHATFSVAPGSIADEDINITITDDDPQDLSTSAYIPVYYKSGSEGYWRKNEATAFAVVRATGGSNRLAWNEYTGGSWTQTEVGNNSYVLSHIFATNDIYNPIIAIQGQATYGNIAKARTGASEEINNLVLTGLPFAEFVPIGTVIYQTSNGYDNAVKARTRSTDLGNNYVDFRTFKLASIGSVNDHGNLAGLTDDDHLQYILVDGSRAFTGNITTKSVIPSADSTYSLGSSALKYDKVWTDNIDVQNLVMDISHKSILYSSSGTVTGDADYFVYDPDNKYVGINKSPPYYTLDVGGTIGAEAAIIVSDNANGTQLVIANTTTADALISFYDVYGGYTEPWRMYVDWSDDNNFKIMKNVFSSPEVVFKLDRSSGYVLFGKEVTSDLPFQIVTQGTAGGLGFDVYSSTQTHEPIVYLRKSASSTAGELSATSIGEDLGQINFKGVDSNNSAFRPASRIQGGQIAAAGSNYVNGDLRLSVMYNGVWKDNIVLYAANKVQIGSGDLYGSTYNLEVGGRARIINSGADTTLYIDNTNGSDGDPGIILAKSGTEKIKIYSDDSDSNNLKINLTTNKYFGREGTNLLWGYKAGQNLGASAGVCIIIGDSAGYNINNMHNIAIGYYAMKYNTVTGRYNIGLGSEALYKIKSGDNNIGIGNQAVHENEDSDDNVGIGYFALRNATGSSNVAIGTYSQYLSTAGAQNVSMGLQSLQNLTIGNKNVALGVKALQNTNGSSNFGLGYETLQAAISGDNNIGIGREVLHLITNESWNVAIGGYSMSNAASGTGNTAIGYQTFRETSGDYGIAIGYQAGYYETNSNRLYITNQQGSDLADGISKAIIYGVMDSTPSNQTLQFNVSGVDVTNETSGAVLNINGTRVDPLAYEMEMEFKTAYSSYFSEFSYTSASDVSAINIYSDSGKGTQLFSKVMTYTSGGDLDNTLLTRESDSATLLKSFTYTSGGDVSAVDVSASY